MADRPGIEQRIVGDHNIQAIESTVTVMHHPSPPRTPAQRNRRAMLDMVRFIWIDGVLHHALDHEVVIALGLQRRPEAVVPPLDLQLRQPGGGAAPLPPSPAILDVYDRAGQALLILGDPGSGKTMLLLTLADKLLARAEQDEAHPIPVVFPLASWAASRRPLAQWLVEELDQRYDVQRKIGQALVDADLLLP